MAAKKSRGRQTTSRTRAEKARITAQRVQAIVDMMASLKWHPREIPKLAKRWGISESRVKNLSAEASRVVKAATGDPEQIRAKFVTALEQIATDARAAKRTLFDSKGKRHVVSAPDFNAATRALGTAADLMGLKRSELEVTGKDGAPLQTGVVVLPALNPDGQAQEPDDDGEDE